ncbi:MAG: YjbQ family protein [Bacteroidales bacterium]|nr:YjbQ family protein [Bacteroidales bacterium]
MVSQTEITLTARPRGFHLVTSEVLLAVGKLPETGLMHLLIKHTSAALTLNENADPSVRADFNSFINRLVKEKETYYTHTLEGADDMPAHIKSSLFGTSLTMPISHGRLNLGNWQGIYLCEFRDYGGNRNLVATVYS